MNRSLYLNRFFASLADYGLMFLIPLAVFKITDDAALAGLAFSIEYFAKVLIGPVVGLLVDRYRLISLITSANLVRAMAAFMCAGAGWFGLSLPVLLVLAVINGIGFTVHFMAQETLLTEIVEKCRFTQVQARVQQFEQSALVTAPMMFSALLVWFDPAGLLALAAMLFALAQLLLTIGARETTLQTPPDAQRKLAEQIRENLLVGQQYLLRSRPLQRIVASTFLINFIYGTLLAIGAVAVTGLFARTESEFALMQTGGAIAAIGVLSLVSRIAQKVSPTQLGFTAFCMMSLGGVLAGLSHNYWLFLVGAVLVLSFDGVFSVYIRTRRMEIIDRKDYGKAIGLLMIVNNLSKPLSGFLVYLLAPWFTVTQILLIATVAVIFGTLGFRLFRVEEIQADPADEGAVLTPP